MGVRRALGTCLTLTPIISVMDFNSVTTTDPESLITRQMFLTMRRNLWKHQQHLKDNPDPSDDWWFLVDPDAPEPCESDWQTGADTL